MRKWFLPFLLLVAWTATPAQETGGVRGRLSDSSGLPIVGAVVRAEGSALQAVSDAEGRYALGPLRPGTWRVTARAAGYAPAAGDVRLPREGETATLDLVLAGGPPRHEPILTVVPRGAPAADGWRRVVGRDAIARAGSIARALARLPGVFVKERGGAQEVSIRGGAPEGTLVLWGEEPLLAPGGGAVDLATLPIAAVDSVEVVGRGASARWGTGAVAGVVRIHASAPRHAGSPEIEGALGVGSGAAREGAVGARLAAGPLTIAAALSADARERSFAGRANGDAARREAFLALRAPRQGVAWSAAFQGSERGAPGPRHAPAPLARTDDERVVVTASADRPLGKWSLRAEAAAQWARSGYRDPDRNGADAASRERSLALRGGAARDFGGQRLDAGLEARVVHAEGTGIAGRPRRIELGVRLEDRWRPGGGAFGVAPSFRLDRIHAAAAGALLQEGEQASADGDAGGAGGARAAVFVSPALAATLDAAPGLELRAFAGRSFRYPGFATLFFLPGLGVRGNPALREERSRDLEVGASWAPSPDLTLEAAAFDRLVEGTIVWLPDFRFVWSPRNLPRAVVRGVELSGRWAPAPGWELRAAWTWAPARFDFPGNRHPLPYRPAHLASAGLAWDGPALRAALEIRVTGSRLPNAAGTNELPPYALVDLTAGWRRPVGSGAVALELELENVLDSRYEVVAAFPAAGRRLRAGLRWFPR